MPAQAAPPDRDQPSPRPLRRDAERNRRRILDAARAQMAEHGLAISYDEVARAADVAVGTVYNRFPAKEDLVHALFHEQVEEVVRSAEQALEVEDPWDAITAFTTQILAMQAGNRGLHQLMAGTSDRQPLAMAANRRIAPIAGELLRRAQSAGVIRADIDHSDFAMIPLMLGPIIEHGEQVDPQLWRRALALIMDGLRSPPRSELPSRPPGQQFQVLLGG